VATRLLQNGRVVMRQMTHWLDCSAIFPCLATRRSLITDYKTTGQKVGRAVLGAPIRIHKNLHALSDTPYPCCPWSRCLVVISTSNDRTFPTANFQLVAIRVLEEKRIVARTVVRHRFPALRAPCPPLRAPT